MDYTKTKIVILENRLALELKEIAEATDRNDHNEAVLIVAKLMGNADIISQLEMLAKQQTKHRYMTKEMLFTRLALLAELLEEVEQRCSPEVYEAINAAI